jgi:parvulin-like peptidyl-prolyl isomerase
LIGDEVTSAVQSLDTKIISDTFIDLKEPVRIKYFLNQLSHEGFYIKDLNEFSIRSSLSSYIRKFIEDQLLTYEAEKMGLNNSADVKKYMSMWRDSYLSKMLMADIFDSLNVSEEEISRHYNSGNMPVELLKIAEVFTDSLKNVELILNELSKGENIHELARQYSKRDSSKYKDWNSGYFPITEFGEIGKYAALMEIGDIYGPVKVDGGYSIFQLVDRKMDTTDYSGSYDNVKDQLVLQLTLSKFEKFVNEFNAKLAQKYDVEIYEDVLSETRNIYLNLVVVRYMGFGGEIYAVPLTEQFSGWYNIWKQENLNP